MSPHILRLHKRVLALSRVRIGDVALEERLARHLGEVRLGEGVTEELF